MSSSFIDALAGSCLYPITDKRISGLSHAEQVEYLCDCGATVIQLREKVQSSKEFFVDAKVALEIARARGVRLIINDRLDIALALGADGVHLGHDDLPPAAARGLLGPHAIIGFSTHNLRQAGLATYLPVDYIAIGPIFSTATKTSSNPPLGLDVIPSVKEVIGNIPLVAIGGITFESVPSVLERGANACSLISDLWDGSSRTARRWPAFSPQNRLQQ
ncbi:MAG TPA: thiamine phosphate synthase [Pyrinomonadaceae bacterium]|nr:thiamine phosphate synthase [Pyrinomonadaceae bacterium]